MKNVQTVRILLVEDEQSDIELTQHAFNRGKLLVDLLVAKDGEEALKRLKRAHPYANAELPDLILLDLNLPKINGREVLNEVKSTPGLKRIPVVVLTTSEADADVIKSYDLGVNCYITKPVDFEQFRKVVESLEEFWFTVAKLPPRKSG